MPEAPFDECGASRTRCERRGHDFIRTFIERDLPSVGVGKALGDDTPLRAPLFIGRNPSKNSQTRSSRPRSASNHVRNPVRTHARGP